MRKLAIALALLLLCCSPVEAKKPSLAKRLWYFAITPVCSARENWLPSGHSTWAFAWRLAGCEAPNGDSVVLKVTKPALMSLLYSEYLIKTTAEDARVCARDMRYWLSAEAEDDGL